MCHLPSALHSPSLQVNPWSSPCLLAPYLIKKTNCVRLIPGPCPQLGFLMAFPCCSQRSGPSSTVPHPSSLSHSWDGEAGIASRGWKSPFCLFTVALLLLPDPERWGWVSIGNFATSHASAGVKPSGAVGWCWGPSDPCHLSGWLIIPPRDPRQTTGWAIKRGKKKSGPFHQKDEKTPENP